MRLLVTGGRDYADAAVVARVLDRALLTARTRGERLTLVHGGARGLDTLAGRWGVWRIAEDCPVDVEHHPADWSRGKRAGHERNARMVAAGADACVAFPGGRGTADALRRARAAGIRCGVVDDAGVLRWDAP